MANSDWDEARALRRWIFGLAAGLMIISAVIAGIMRVAGLSWFPWEIQMQTKMIRASNWYVTTQQTALRQLRAGYEDAATDGQRQAIVRQMQEIADVIPGDVQPDISVFLQSREGGSP